MSEPNTVSRLSERDVRAGEQPCFARALGRARLAIFWERLWPALASIATAVGLFLALSWLGLWVSLPPLGRAIGLFAFFVLAVAATVPLFQVRWPSAIEGLRRLDRKSLLPHRPATAIADRMAPEAGDQFAVALWRAHLERALRAATALKAGTPVPQVAARDPYALRGLVLILAVAAFFAAGGDRIKRIAAAFDWHGVVTPANYRIDAWVTPPAYTGRPPLILPGLRPGEQSQARAKRPGDGAGRLDAGGARHRPIRTRHRRQRRHRGGQGRSEAAGAQGHRGAPLHHHRRRHRHGQGRQRRRGLDLQRHPGSSADHRARQGAGTPAPRLAAAQLQARGRLRRGGRAGDLRAQDPPRRHKPALDRGQAAAPAVRRAQFHPGAAAGAHPRRRRPDHQGSVRASLGRRRRGDDARRPRRGQQRGPLQRRTRCGCRSGRLPSRCRAR